MKQDAKKRKEKVLEKDAEQANVTETVSARSVRNLFVGLQMVAQPVRKEGKIP